MRDPDKRRFLDAARHIETEEIPLFEVGPDMALARQIMGKDFPMDRLVYELPIPDYIELNRRMGNDMIYFAHIWRLGRKQQKDAEGRLHYIDGMMKTPDDLKNIWFPDLDLQQRRLEELLNRLQGTGMGVVCQTQSAPFVVATAMGYEDFWVNAKWRLGFVEEFIHIIQDWCLRELETFLRFPVEVIKVASAFVTKTGPMCSPEMLERLETRYLRQQVQMAKEHGKLVFHHIDGNITRMIPDFIQMGIDILNPIEPCAGLQDIYAIKNKYGDRIALCGNIDVDGALLHGSPEEITGEVRERIDRLGEGGGYICASSHDLHHLIPVENLYAMRDAVHQCRFVRPVDGKGTRINTDRLGIKLQSCGLVHAYAACIKPPRFPVGHHLLELSREDRAAATLPYQSIHFKESLVRKSKVLAKLRSGQFARISATGHFLPFFVRYAARYGYDGIWLDLEHRTMNDREVQAIIAACYYNDIDCMVRPQTLGRSHLYHYLEDGAAGFMVPFVSTPDIARQIVEAIKFPPLGNRGVDGAGLDGDYGMEAWKPNTTYFDDANRETFFVAQIETPKAVENIEAVAAVPGVDCVFIGPGDLGLRLRISGSPMTMPDVVERVAAAARQNQVAWGITVGSVDDLSRYRKLGAQIVPWGGDFALMNVLKQCSEELDGVLAEESR